MIKNKQSHNLMNYLIVFLLLISGPVAASAPAVGTIIKNQATATYKDSSGIEQTATSNLVETLVQQVAAFTLDQDHTRYGIAGEVTSFPHVLTNTGNGDDTFTLTASDNSGDVFDFDSIDIYPDVNQDGIADSNTTINSTGLLAAGESFYFVVSTSIPTSATDLQTGEITVSGISSFDNSTQINIDEVIVSANAVVTVTKSISASSGVVGGGPYTVTLTYINQSTEDATDVKLIDDLPTGMTYVPNSGSWNLLGDALTDSDLDIQGSAPDTVVYCAYDATCVGEETQVTATIAQVAANNSGTISFDIMLDTLDATTDVNGNVQPLLAQILLNTAEFEYDNGSVDIINQNTNTVALEVLASPGVVANGSETDSTDLVDEPVNQTTATLGSTVSFDNIIWNRGNSIDTFDISISEINATAFPDGTIFTLYQSDGFTPLLDTNNSSIVDTGPLAVGESYKVVLKAILPLTAVSVSDNGGVGFDVTKTAISAINPSITNSVTDHLGSITGSSVDLTNAAAFGDNGALGEGEGPASSPVTEITVAPGQSGVFILYVNNTGSVADSFNLTYSDQDSPFVAGQLPTGWSVSFYADAGTGDCSELGSVVSNTGVIAGGSERLICAEVTVPADSEFDGSAVSLYFQVESVLTGASDIKHDAVVIGADYNLVLDPDLQAQVEPGGTQTYVHRLHNPGNTDITDIELVVTDSLSADGWTTALYEDTDGDGVLSGGDSLISSGSYPLLMPGETQIIFAQVFAPTNALSGTRNTSVITAEGTADIGSVANPSLVDVLVSAQDITVVATNNMSIVKRQALDSLCNGIPDSVYGFDALAAMPNECVLYQLVATNQSVGTVNNVRIDDLIPEFTSHFIVSGVQPSISVGSIVTQPLDGDTGLIEGAAGDVASGESVTLTFGVKVE